MTYIQHPPYCVQVELTEGCNLRCPFCGINGIRTAERLYQFMSLGTGSLIAEAMAHARWMSRVEFAMHGEPTKNPNCLGIIQKFRLARPHNYLLMETNGSGFLAADSAGTAAKIAAFFEAGLNTIAVDEYKNVAWAEAVRRATPLLRDVCEYYEYPEQPQGNPHTRSRRKRLVIVAPIDVATTGTHATLNNHCGNGAPLDYSAAGKRCAKPFREISVRWDGNVALCCNDWRGTYKVGNVGDTPLYELWHSDAFDAARRKLLLGLRDFGPCLGCNAISYRVGLLPDPMGQETLPIPDARCLSIIRRALQGKPYTRPVLRPWETIPDYAPKGRLV